MGYFVIARGSLTRSVAKFPEDCEIGEGRWSYSSLCRLSAGGDQVLCPQETPPPLKGCSKSKKYRRQTRPRCFSNPMFLRFLKASATTWNRSNGLRGE